VFDEDRATAVQAGCDVFLGKPCLPDELAWEIEHLLASGRTSSTDSTRRRNRSRIVLD
jgi:DNA-binding response OmpR family regulator